jgi:short-subunit dehydrogenase
MAGLIPLPGKSVYGGSKAYVVGFSKSLRRELKYDKISVSVLCPGAMNTTWQLMVLHRTIGSWLSRQSVVEPCDAARIAIQQLLRGKEVIVPGAWNRCFLVWNRIFPKWFKNHLADYVARKTPQTIEAVVPMEPMLQPIVA